MNCFWTSGGIECRTGGVSDGRCPVSIGATLPKPPQVSESLLELFKTLKRLTAVILLQWTTNSKTETPVIVILFQTELSWCQSTDTWRASQGTCAKDSFEFNRQKLIQWHDIPCNTHKKECVFVGSCWRTDPWCRIWIYLTAAPQQSPVSSIFPKNCRSGKPSLLIWILGHQTAWRPKTIQKFAVLSSACKLFRRISFGWRKLWQELLCFHAQYAGVIIVRCSVVHRAVACWGDVSTVVSDPPQAVWSSCVQRQHHATSRFFMQCHKFVGSSCDFSVLQTDTDANRAAHMHRLSWNVPNPRPLIGKPTHRKVLHTKRHVLSNPAPRFELDKLMKVGTRATLKPTLCCCAVTISQQETNMHEHDALKNTLS